MSSLVQVQQPIPKRVLVVDDEASLRELLAEALRDVGFTVDTAANGVQALTRMHEAVPDVVVLDLMMPRLDGSGFSELMRLNPRFASVPLLLVTAAYHGQRAAEQLGARAWLSKPFELDQLVAAVVNLAGSPQPMPRLNPAHLPNSRGKTSSTDA